MKRYALEHNLYPPISNPEKIPLVRLTIAFVHDVRKMFFLSGGEWFDEPKAWERAVECLELVRTLDVALPPDPEVDNSSEPSAERKIT